LKVYNVLGQEVATPVNSVQQAGSHTVSFNASNLSSGVYFYRLITAGFTQTYKMVLQK
jgi:Secretion system C-terminal sorting domain